jgi:cellulose synthase/poly-beta-1,6-N-acetylglucosamine synthase-like glycosyltransferase
VSPFPIDGLPIYSYIRYFFPIRASTCIPTPLSYQVSCRNQGSLPHLPTTIYSFLATYSPSPTVYTPFRLPLPHSSIPNLFLSIIPLLTTGTPFLTIYTLSLTKHISFADYLTPFLTIYTLFAAICIPELTIYAPFLMIDTSFLAIFTLILTIYTSFITNYTPLLITYTPSGYLHSLPECIHLFPVYSNPFLDFLHACPASHTPF